MKTAYLPLLFISVLAVTGINCQLFKVIGDLITVLIEITRFQNLIWHSYHRSNDKKETKFDFVIVGSGPSGSVLANRLTENSDITVLLLENGDEPSFITDIPLAAGALEFSSFNYGYKSEKQEGFCKGCEDGRLQWPHGNVLGGSSTINYMIFVRGNPHDYDIWESMGNPGWSYKDMLPYFKKMEDAHVKLSDSEYRSQGGYLSVTDVPFNTKIRNIYVNASVEAGHEYVDYNGRVQMGVSNIQATLKKGLRCSAEKAYLRPVRQRKNLKIRVKSKVTKILINPNTKTAYGVEYVHNGKRYYAYAKKEVILSAGVLNSPQILMLSGVGPKDHLNELGIPVIQDLPVGKKMYDHATYPMLVFEVNENVVVNLAAELLNPINYLKFIKGYGILSSIGTVEAITYIKTNVSTDPNPDFPDVEVLMIGGSLSTDYGFFFRKIFNISPKIYSKFYKPLEKKNVYQLFPVLLHPKSYGYIKLNKKDPEGAPLFYANYFSDPENNDIKTMIAGIREVQKINTMPTLQKYGAKLLKTPVPGCEDKEFNSDEYLECALRTFIGSFYHQVATCKMGPQSDPETVVDHNLKVHGIKKLRVVDTSIIPFPTSAHNVGPAYVIGEKAAALLKESWNI